MIMWIIGAITVVVVAVVLVVVLVIQNSDSGSNAASQKADITKLTTAMLVDESAFPAVDGGKFDGPQLDLGNKNDYGRNPTIDPAECAPFYFGPRTDQTAHSELIGHARVVNVYLAVPVEKPDFRALASNCSKFKTGGSHTTTVEQRSMSALPDWAAAFSVATERDRSTMIVGYYRDLYVLAGGLSRGDTSEHDDSDIVKLFNDQIAKLKAAD